MADMSSQVAREDLKSRTLAALRDDFSRLVYLSSLRDFTTGNYHHEGLERRFSRTAAATALAACHHEIFDIVTTLPLETLVKQIDRFIRFSAPNACQALAAWETLEAYRTVVPMDCDQLMVALFRSNLKVAIAILKTVLAAEVPVACGSGAADRQLVDGHTPESGSTRSVSGGLNVAQIGEESQRPAGEYRQGKRTPEPDHRGSQKRNH